MPRVHAAARRARARVLLGAALGVVVGATAPVLLVGVVAAPAHAFSQLVVSPLAAVPGGVVTVAGRCPETARDPYVAATIGIEKLGQSARVEVADGAFTGTLVLTPIGDLDPVIPGNAVAVQASCHTESEFVASAGTQKVAVVEQVAVDTVGGVDSTAAQAGGAPLPVAPSSTPVSPSARPGSTTAGSTTAGAAPTASPVALASDETPSFAVPILAGVIAVLGTIGAFVVSRRSRERADAMVGHPAQRGVGREPLRRDAK